MIKLSTKFKETDIGSIPEEWGVLELDALTSLIIDHRGLTPKKLGGDWADTGVQAISAKNIKDNRLANFDELKFVSQTLYKKWMPVELEASDVLLTSEAPLGETYFVKPDDKFCLSQRLFALRTKKELLNSNYLFFYLQSPCGRQELQGRATGSVVHGIRQSELLKIKVVLPSNVEQKQIAEICSSLDDKIELNRHMNATLEETAAALFKRWFVDYEFPNADGKPYNSSGGKMVESELGAVPEGWRAGQLGEAIENFDSKRIPLSSMQRDKRRGAYPYYGATSIMDYVDDYIFDGTYLLLGEDGSVAKEDGTPFVQYVAGKIWVNNHAHVLQGKSGFSTEYIKIFLDKVDIQPFVTGAVQPKLNQANMNSIPMVIPDQKTLVAFNQISESVFGLILQNESQIKNLVKVRDSLLPRLMSGKIRTN